LRCDNLEKYLEEILRQNETFRTQVITLNAKVDMLTSDLQDNRITR
jgi:methionyl-tRNA synthetase